MIPNAGEDADSFAARLEAEISKSDELPQADAALDGDR